MSYSTRRSGRGMNNTQTQVNYHQQPPMGRGIRPGANQGYSTTGIQNFQQQPFVSQGYSTEPPPTPPVQKVAPPTPAAQAQQPPPPPQAQQQPPVQDIIKNESQMETADSEATKDTNGEGKTSNKPFWMKKGPSVKISRKTRKRRQNARLRRLLIPKNALMFLNELHPQANFTCQGRVNALNQYVYTVTVEIDGKVFSGQGMSKLAAKAQASEDALKVLVLEKMAKAQLEMPPMDTSMSGDDIEMDDDIKESEAGDDEATEGKPRRKFPEDDMPWGSLAAFALHKLFTDWQQQGTQLPLAAKAISPSPMPMSGGKSGAPNPIKKIPEDAKNRHPVTLLNYLKPGSTYKETHEGMPPNMVFTITVNIDGTDYVGTGTNKKEARKECAKAALAAMGIQCEM